jgi:hypothetical protein
MDAKGRLNRPHGERSVAKELEMRDVALGVAVVHCASKQFAGKHTNHHTTTSTTPIRRIEAH